MDWWLVLLLITGSLIIIFLTGIPVAFGFLVINFVGILYFMGPAGFPQLILSIFTSLSKFTLVPVPMFILMGSVIFHSGMAINILHTLDKLLGRLPGRLSLLALVSGTLFSNLTGSTMANTAMLGELLVPEMTRMGYKKSMTLGPILGTGGLAMIIPPSTLAVILGSLAEISIGKLLIAGILPGILMASLYGSYIIVRCHLQPHLAPVYEVPPTPLSEKITSLVRYVLPMVFIIFMVLGTIFLGVATPTEAAALGAIGSFILAAIYGKLSLEVIKKSVTTCIAITVMALMIICSSLAFSQLLAFTGATRSLTEWVVSLNVPLIFILIGMQLLLLVFGTFMDQVAMMMITIPIYMPIIISAGVNPIWFGIMMLISLEVGLTSPPFGMLLFVMKGVCPKDTTMGDLYLAALPFIGCDFIALALILIFPQIATYLPSISS